MFQFESLGSGFESIPYNRGVIERINENQLSFVS